MYIIYIYTCIQNIYIERESEVKVVKVTLLLFSMYMKYIENCFCLKIFCSLYNYINGSFREAKFIFY